MSMMAFHIDCVGALPLGVEHVQMKVLWEGVQGPFVLSVTVRQ